jgi:hypothetical protein
MWVYGRRNLFMQVVVNPNTSPLLLCLLVKGFNFIQNCLLALPKVLRVLRHHHAQHAQMCTPPEKRCDFLRLKMLFFIWGGRLLKLYCLYLQRNGLSASADSIPFELVDFTPDWDFTVGGAKMILTFKTSDVCIAERQLVVMFDEDQVGITMNSSWFNGNANVLTAWYSCASIKRL